MTHSYGNYYREVLVGRISFISLNIKEPLCKGLSTEKLYVSFLSFDTVGLEVLVLMDGIGLKWQELESVDVGL